VTDAPVQAKATVLTVRQVATYHAMTLVAPAVAERFRPGQFVALAVGGPHTKLLSRRCFSVYGVKADYGGTVEFVFAERDAGTRWLAGLRSRDSVDLVGPLGRPFPLPRDPVTCVLVGVAHGSAALFPLASVLGQRDCRLHFILGGDSSDEVLGARGARRTGDSVAVTTADGSLGTAGAAADLLPEVVESTQADVVYVCGPLETLRAVSRTCTAFGIPAQVAVEEPMACGTGVCMACVLPVVGDDGGTHMMRTCVEGPVFRGERVRWDDVGTIPFDALGAPRALRLGERA
jgi:dihydroorotate dehydrogenase electron transfer subunit